MSWLSPLVVVRVREWNCLDSLRRCFSTIILTPIVLTLILSMLRGALFWGRRVVSDVAGTLSSLCQLFFMSAFWLWWCAIDDFM